MYIFTSKYNTPLDRFINKFRKKGFLLYSGLILLSVGYVMYELSHLPQLPPKPNKKHRKDVIEELQSDQENLNDINTWSKQQLFEYLHKQKIYPDIDEDISTIRKMVYDIYQSNKSNI